MESTKDPARYYQDAPYYQDGGQYGNYSSPSTGQLNNDNPPSQGRPSDYNYPPKGQFSNYNSPSGGYLSDYNPPSGGQLSDYNSPSRGRQPGDYNAPSKSQSSNYDSPSRDQLGDYNSLSRGHSSHHNSPSGGPPPDYNASVASDQQTALFLEQVTGWIPRQPPVREARMFRLERPVVIPRIDIARPFAVQLPFMRAYSPALYRHDISVETFVAFIDNLAVAEAAPVPLQALNVAGQAIGFVPHHWAQAASTGITMAAGISTAAISRIRTSKYMEAVNRDYFGPRGLKVSICKGHELAPKIGVGQLLPEIPPVDLRSQLASIRDRQMLSISANIAPLSLDVPPPSEQRNFIDKLSAKQIESQIKSNEKKGRKTLEKLREKETKNARASSSHGKHKDSDSSDSDWEEHQKLDEKIQRINRRANEKMAEASPRQASKIEEKREKEVQKLERELRKLEKEAEKKMSKSEKKISKDSKKVDKKLAEDNKKVGKMEFIVVENL